MTLKNPIDTAVMREFSPCASVVSHGTAGATTAANIQDDACLNRLQRKTD